MAEATIVAIAGISGTLLAGLGATVLGHILGERRAKAEVRRAYKERRLFPLMKLITDIVTLTTRLHISTNEKERKTIFAELAATIENRAWAESAIAFGIDERLDDKKTRIIELLTEYIGAIKERKRKSKDSSDTERIGRIRTEVAMGARELISLCYEILEQG